MRLGITLWQLSLLMS